MIRVEQTEHPAGNFQRTTQQPSRRSRNSQCLIRQPRILPHICADNRIAPPADLFQYLRVNGNIRSNALLFTVAAFCGFPFFLRSIFKKNQGTLHSRCLNQLVQDLFQERIQVPNGIDCRADLEKNPCLIFIPIAGSNDVLSS